MLGSYSPHRLFIRIASEGDLDPEVGEPLPHAVAIHAHEYVHYLHNVSTTAGLHLFVANLWITRCLRSRTDARGHFRSDLPLPEDQQQYLQTATALIDALWGGTAEVCKVPKGGRWSFGAMNKENRVFAFSDGSQHRIGIVEIEANIPDNATPNTKLRVGYYLISEGIAYAVDRELRNFAGMPVSSTSSDAPYYPYVAYGDLVDHLAQRTTTTVERIKVGVASLLTSSPGETFFEVCAKLRGKQEFDLAKTIAPITSTFNATWDRLVRCVIQEIDAVSLGGPLRTAGKEISRIVETATRARAYDNFLELSFVGGHLTESAYRKRIASLVDCCVIQQKPAGEYAWFGWVGRGVAAADESSAEKIAVFQACLEYAGWHPEREGRGFRATSSLPHRICPYFDACPLRQDVCKSRPWDRFPVATKSGGDPKCWFSAGVLVFGNP